MKDNSIIKRPPEITKEDYRFDEFDNGRVLENKKQGRLPAMGWNSWNAFGSNNTEELTKIMADRMVELGLDKLGYEYVILDDGCYLPERVNGKLKNEPVKFPHDFKVLSDYIHSKGLKFGMYNDIGTNLCAGAAVGTCGHEIEDATSYVNWGVDFIKVDNCYYPWDNATFSDATNAKYVYGPVINEIRISKKSEGVSDNQAKKDGDIYCHIYKENEFMDITEGNGIGTYDGTGPDRTPVGSQSTELKLEVNAPIDGEYLLCINALCGKEIGCGSWIQINVNNVLIFDDFADCLDDYPFTSTDTAIGEAVDDGMNVIVGDISDDAVDIIASEAADDGVDNISSDAVDDAVDNVSSDVADDGMDIIASDTIADSADDISGDNVNAINNENRVVSFSIVITLHKGENTIRIMNHRRQENTLMSYGTFLAALNKAKPDHDVLLSICEWGKTQPQNWGYKVGDSWRILNDITFQVGNDGDPGSGSWESDYTTSVTAQYNKSVIMDSFAGLTKGWNDPDMLMIGMNGLDETMCRTHMTMWCMMNSPLMLGLDLRRVQKGDALYNIIANKEVIALNQDTLGIQARRIKIFVKGPDSTRDKADCVYVMNGRKPLDYVRDNKRIDVLLKPLSDGSVALSFINLDNDGVCDFAPWANKEEIAKVLDELELDELSIKMRNAEQFRVTDLWSGELKMVTDGIFTIEDKNMKAHDQITYKISPLFE